MTEIGGTKAKQFHGIGQQQSTQLQSQSGGSFAARSHQYQVQPSNHHVPSGPPPSRPLPPGPRAGPNLPELNQSVRRSVSFSESPSSLPSQSRLSSISTLDLTEQQREAAGPPPHIQKKSGSSQSSIESYATHTENKSENNRSIDSNDYQEFIKDDIVSEPEEEDMVQEWAKPDPIGYRPRREVKGQEKQYDNNLAGGGLEPNVASDAWRLDKPVGLDPTAITLKTGIKFGKKGGAATGIVVGAAAGGTVGAKVGAAIGAGLGVIALPLAVLTGGGSVAVGSVVGAAVGGVVGAAVGGLVGFLTAKEIAKNPQDEHIKKALGSLEEEGVTFSDTEKERLESLTPIQWRRLLHVSDTGTLNKQDRQYIRKAAILAVAKTPDEPLVAAHRVKNNMKRTIDALNTLDAKKITLNEQERGRLDDIPPKYLRSLLVISHHRVPKEEDRARIQEALVLETAKGGDPKQVEKLKKDLIAAVSKQSMHFMADVSEVGHTRDLTGFMNKYTDVIGSEAFWKSKNPKEETGNVVTWSSPAAFGSHMLLEAFRHIQDPNHIITEEDRRQINQGLAADEADPSFIDDVVTQDEVNQPMSEERKKQLADMMAAKFDPKSGSTGWNVDTEKRDQFADAYGLDNKKKMDSKTLEDKLRTLEMGEGLGIAASSSRSFINQHLMNVAKGLDLSSLPREQTLPRVRDDQVPSQRGDSRVVKDYIEKMTNRRLLDDTRGETHNNAIFKKYHDIKAETWQDDNTGFLMAVDRLGAMPLNDQQDAAAFKEELAKLKRDFGEHGTQPVNLDFRKIQGFENALTEQIETGTLESLAELRRGPLTAAREEIHIVLSKNYEGFEKLKQSLLDDLPPASAIPDAARSGQGGDRASQVEQAMASFAPDQQDGKELIDIALQAFEWPNGQPEAGELDQTKLKEAFDWVTQAFKNREQLALDKDTTATWMRRRYAGVVSGEVKRLKAQ